ncbi:MAG: hypothetical protein ACKN9S_13940, partial [Pirellula sp.]
MPISLPSAHLHKTVGYHHERPWLPTANLSEEFFLGIMNFPARKFAAVSRARLYDYQVRYKHPWHL